MKKVLLAALVTASITALGLAQAQSFRWIDSAGNIQFTDDIRKVPPRYRNQVVPPTPTVFMTKELLFRQQQDARRKEMEERRRQEDKRREEMRKRADYERELDRRRKEEERQRRIDDARRQEDSLRQAQKEVSDTAQ